MELQFRLVGDVPRADVSSLHRWLERDEEVRRSAVVSLADARSRPDDMGGVADIITVIFADAGAVAGIGSLVIAYRSWRENCGQGGMSLVIEQDGQRVTLTGGSEEELRQVLETFARLKNGHDGSRAS
ncbi:hypothetical protein E1287_33860 [Actinomadura sp. KC06]|uniref:effector-associated constant component EACC1 n=1 Tax=Actinomadura sp. KC06 TaxID=2530369 RepID=UPI001051A7EE|nr:hypothetical protein [Actinomadura sp. KC06]TDD27803.1 hypothetical protein E1287_33860 [Actinomadura sp. KC06]